MWRSPRNCRASWAEPFSRSSWRGPATAEHRTVSGRWSADGSERGDTGRDPWSGRDPDEPDRGHMANITVANVPPARRGARKFLAPHSKQ